MEDIEEQFITSYLSILAKEGKEICKEVDTLFKDKDELTKKRAITYCHFVILNCDNDDELFKRCSKYLEKVNLFHKCQFTFNQAILNIKEEERFKIEK